MLDIIVKFNFLKFNWIWNNLHIKNKPVFNFLELLELLL